MTFCANMAKVRWVNRQQLPNLAPVHNIPYYKDEKETLNE